MRGIMGNYFSWPTEIEKSINLMTAEKVTDMAYKGMVGILDLVPEFNKGIAVNSAGESGYLKDDMDALMPIKTSLYCPASERFYYKGFFDAGVDDLPEAGTVYVDNNKDNILEYIVVKKIDRIPRNIYTVCPNPIANYKIMQVDIASLSGSSLRIKRVRSDLTVFLEISYLQIDQTGKVWSTVSMKKRQQGFMDNNDRFHAYNFGSGALSLLADRKYLWMVNTSEPLKTHNNKEYFASVQLGVEEEHVKSLFFARELPLTAAGRRNPILHWVRAHKRRIKEGVKIDVTKHMRGIESFEMLGLNFKITEPTKAKTKRERGG